MIAPVECLECKAALHGRQKKYCSILCRNTAMGRKPKGNFHVYCVCETCSFLYTKKKSAHKRSKYCSRKCQGHNLIKKEPE